MRAFILALVFLGGCAPEECLQKTTRYLCVEGGMPSECATVIDCLSCSEAATVYKDDQPFACQVSAQEQVFCQQDCMPECIDGRCDLFPDYTDTRK